MIFKNKKFKYNKKFINNNKFKENKTKKPKNTKGYYPYPWNDLLNDTTSIDMVKLSPDPISVLKIDNMYDNYLSEIEKLMNLYYKYKEKGELHKIKNKDMMKINNYLEHKNKDNTDDLKELEKRISYQPKTSLGKITKLMLFLKKAHLGNNEEMGLSIYLRLMEDELNINKYPELKSKYERHLKWLYLIKDKYDFVKYQMTEKHNIMPPLNEKGFKKLDNWQKEAIKNMRENKSLILSVPTSGGKTYLSAYLTTNKGKIYFIAPSIPLARQVSAYLSNVTNSKVPYITETYRPILYHKEMLDCLKRSKIIVSTPDVFLDFLPELPPLTENDNIVIDEIHMMGTNEGDAMELICLLNNKAKLLGLSATISNPNDIKMWNDKVNIIECKDRFFNLQTSYWDTNDKMVKDLNPLALLKLRDFTSKKVLDKDLKPTPVDIYNLGVKLEDKFGDLLGDLRLNIYFEHAKIKRLELNEVLRYFNKLILFMTENADEYKNNIKEIINSFTPVNLDYEEINLLDVIHNLKETKNTPVLIFQRNTYSLMRIARDLIKEIDINENKDNPNRLKNISKNEKKAKQVLKKMEKSGLLNKEKNEKNNKNNKNNSEKIEKKQNNSGLEEIYVEHFQNPTEKYNWNVQILMSHSEIDQIAHDLKKYFPFNGDFYHPIIHALWRGIGIYAEGLPNEYLVLVQVLANQKKLGVVLSDKSMTFGVSMPFRNVIIYYDKNSKDDLNPLLFKQMEGRAGRRGQDTKGSVIFVGYSWKRIEELSISEIPKINGQKIDNKFLPLGERISELSKINGYESIWKNLLDKNLYKLQKNFKTNRDYNKYKKFWEENISDKWDDIVMLRMLWYTRKYGNDGLVFYNLVDLLEKHFSNGAIDEPVQVEISYILSFFTRLYETDNDEYKLVKNDKYTKWKEIRDNLNIDLIDDNIIDGRIYCSIRNNDLLHQTNADDYEELRKKFYEFACFIRIIQNYCFYSKRVNLARIFGKLFTRCKWMLWNSSPLMNFTK